MPKALTNLPNIEKQYNTTNKANNKGKGKAMFTPGKTAKKGATRKSVSK